MSKPNTIHLVQSYPHAVGPSNGSRPSNNRRIRHRRGLRGVPAAPQSSGNNQARCCRPTRGVSSTLTARSARPRRGANSSILVDSPSQDRSRRRTAAPGRSRVYDSTRHR
jgi:hypothetical protein